MPDPIYDAPPLSRDVLDRVLTEPEDVPQAAPSSPLELAVEDFGSLLGAALEGAATRPEMASAKHQAARVLLLTADWCTMCRPAKQQAAPWLTSLGYQVEIVDVTRGLDRRFGVSIPRSLPTWVFLLDGREVYRQEGGYLPQHLADAVKKVPVTHSPAVGAWLGPTVRIADALPLVVGKTLNLGSAATVSVPSDLKWTMTQKARSVVLSFDPSPQVVVHKVLNWRVRLEGVEITPTAITLQIDNFPDVTIKFDWSCPARSSRLDIDARDDLHRASRTRRQRGDRPLLSFLGKTVLFTYRVCAIASFVMAFV